MSLEKRRQAETKGREAENRARRHLEASGWRILGQRVRAPRGSGAGELDLIALKGSILAFCEVKARKDVTMALEAVTPTQRQRLWRAAEAYLATQPAFASFGVRFDVLVVTGEGPIHHIEDAWR
ncbi:MAG: YraN family protein, partial [Rhodospirillaceae bacterium]